MLSILYPYRERDLERIRFSLNSLSKQTYKAFQVFFIDYGSTPEHANQVKALLKDFPFVKYTYHYTQFQPWNKSKALNSIIKFLDTDYFFVADIDIIFHADFVKTLKELSKTNKVWYFKVGFLSEAESALEKPFEQYNIKFESNKEATGLTFCPTNHAKSLHGFDELFHFWGGEDTDFHVRLTNAGYNVNYYDKNILMLHKWHKTYRNTETNKLSKSLQIKGVVQFNHLHLQQAIRNKKTKVNASGWGRHFKVNEFYELPNKKQIKTLYNKAIIINYFLFHELPNLKSGIHHFQFKPHDKSEKFKFWIKKRLNKQKNLEYYSLKTINDLLLYNLTNKYHDLNYKYHISPELDAIYLSIKINKYT